MEFSGETLVKFLFLYFIKYFSKDLEFASWLSGKRTRLVFHEDMGLIPCLTQGVKDPALPRAVVQVTDVYQIPCCWEVWHRLAATALIRLLAWKLLYVAGAALKRQKNKTKRKKNFSKDMQ